MATIETKLQPFSVPNFAIVEEPAHPRQEGFRDPRAIPISELPDSTLQQMAADWLRDLYDRAGKRYNWRFD